MISLELALLFPIRLISFLLLPLLAVVVAATAAIELIKTKQKTKPVRTTRLKAKTSHILQHFKRTRKLKATLLLLSPPESVGDIWTVTQPPVRVSNGDFFALFQLPNSCPVDTDRPLISRRWSGPHCDCQRRSTFALSLQTRFES